MSRIAEDITNGRGWSASDVLDLATEHIELKQQLSNKSRLLDMAEGALKDIHACFIGAECEGLLNKLQEADKQPGTLGDLVERRLMFAEDYALTGIAAIQEGKKNG